MNLLHSYDNGNCHVELYDDGTKIRTFEGSPQPVYPECIDVKITDYCDAKCAYCHEKSTVDGMHCDKNSFFDFVGKLTPGTELAIGGGNPLAHPDIKEFLVFMRDRGIVANMTINQLHLRRQRQIIDEFLDEKLINGVGVSYSSKSYLKDVESLLKKTDNVVVHLIAGVNDVSDFYDIHNVCSSLDAVTKVLVLGYKHFGFGAKFYQEHSLVEEQIYDWHVNIGKMIRSDDSIVSFDNLAIDQMKIRRFIKDDLWNELYMGDDFQFTMYVDVVKKQYAKSSTSVERVNFSEMSLIDFFQSDKKKTRLSVV